MATVCVFLWLIARFWHPVYGFTAFFQLDASNDEVKMEAFKALPVYVYRDTGGYDGLYYAQLALDPTLRDSALPGAMDNAPYRARRILPSTLAWLAGGGRARNVIAAYSVINIVAWLALALLLWRTLPVVGGRSLLAWFGILFSAGALCSVRLALTDLVAGLLLTAAIAAAEAERKKSALGFLAGAALARETALLSVAGLIKPPWGSWKNLARVVLAAAPLFLWLVYVRRQLGPADQGWGNLTWPVTGVIMKWKEVLAAFGRTNDLLLVVSTLLALIALCIQALYLAKSPHLADRWWRTGAAYVGLLLCLGTAVWEGFPGAATRVLLPLTISFNIVATRARAALAWLLLGNLGVVAGVLALRDVPTDSHEIAAARAGESAAIARVDEGWFDREQTRRHVWYWSQQRGQLTLETWPKTIAPLRLQFGLRSLVARTVTLRVDGREIWHAEVNTTRTDHTVDLIVTGGKARLEFSTNSPAIAEGSQANARALGFALYDLRVGVRKD